MAASSRAPAAKTWHAIISSFPPLSTFSADNFLPRERVPRQRRSTSSSDLFPFRLVCIPWRDFDIFNRSGDANASAAPAHQLFSLSHSLCGQRCQRRPFCCAELGLLEKNTHTQVTTPKVPHYISCVCRCIAHVCGRASTPVAIAGFCFFFLFPYRTRWLFYYSSSTERVYARLDCLIQQQPWKGKKKKAK